MKKWDSKHTTTPAKSSSNFFSKHSSQAFFGSRSRSNSFFCGELSSSGATSTQYVQHKCADGQENINIQRQNEPDRKGEKAEVKPNQLLERASQVYSPRVKRCYGNPKFTDFQCLVYTLKQDVDENVRRNAHQFFRVATLFPDDKVLMWDTFLRYGLGANLLNTSFGFIGASEKWGNILSYGTGGILKTYDFVQNGKLQLDVPLRLGKNTWVEFKLDLNANPDNLSQIRDVNVGVGITRKF